VTPIAFDHVPPPPPPPEWEDPGCAMRLMPPASVILATLFERAAIWANRRAAKLRAKNCPMCGKFSMRFARWRDRDGKAVHLDRFDPNPNSSEIECRGVLR
jgi:hypothetical protein